MKRRKPLKKFSMRHVSHRDPLRTLSSLIGTQRIHRGFQQKWWTSKKTKSNFYKNPYSNCQLTKLTILAEKFTHKIDENRTKSKLELTHSTKSNLTMYLDFRLGVEFYSSSRICRRLYWFGSFCSLDRHTIKPCSRNASRWYASIQLDHKWWTFSASYLLAGKHRRLCLCVPSFSRPLFHHCVRTIRTIQRTVQAALGHWVLLNE